MNHYTQMKGQLAQISRDGLYTKTCYDHWSEVHWVIAVHVIPRKATQHQVAVNIIIFFWSLKFKQVRVSSANWFIFLVHVIWSRVKMSSTCCGNERWETKEGSLLRVTCFTAICTVNRLIFWLFCSILYIKKNRKKHNSQWLLV